MKQHVIPGSSRAVLRRLVKGFVAEEARGHARSIVSSKVGEDVSLEFTDLGEDFGAIQDLERTQKIGLGLKSNWNRQYSIIGLENVSAI